MGFLKSVVKLNAKLTSGLNFVLRFCLTNFRFGSFPLFSLLFFPIFRSIIEENARDFEYAVASPRRVVCKSNFRMPLCKVLLSVSSCQCFYFSKLGFRLTSSGKMNVSPIRSIAFLSNDFKAFFMGVAP